MAKSRRYDLETTLRIRRNIVRLILNERREIGNRESKVTIEDEFSFLGLEGRTYYRYRKEGYIVEELENFANIKNLDIKEFFRDDNFNYVKPSFNIENANGALKDIENDSCTIKEQKDSIAIITTIVLLIVVATIMLVGILYIDTFGAFLLHVVCLAIAFTMRFYANSQELKICRAILTAYVFFCGYKVMDTLIPYLPFHINF